MKWNKNTQQLVILIALIMGACNPKEPRQILSFNENWKFHLGDIENAMSPQFEDSSWRNLSVPHDWSIEGEFSVDNPATPGGGALPGGKGWYRKTFYVSDVDSGKVFFIDFDGVYCNSEVWINGQYLGKRPYGYSSFRYDLTRYLKFNNEKNILAVKVDNSLQPNSRWYSGSGIYRNVWLVITNKIHIDHWGTYITTPEISEKEAGVKLELTFNNNTSTDKFVLLKTQILNKEGRIVARISSKETFENNKNTKIIQELKIVHPHLWSIDDPYLYQAVTEIKYDGKTKDKYTTGFGVRYFTFDTAKGFFLNGKHLKINGVCNHHDLGCLGAAINYRAIERQLEMLKEMGCNGIRTSHNPPAPELLDLCDKMGFIVMDEAFDMWKIKKTEYDYHLYYDKWHKQDLQDMIRRDRNHPSVFIWSIGNEIIEQWDTSGIQMAIELASLVRDIDTTRPITSACNDPNPWNNIIKSGALDLIGYNYHHEMYKDFPATYPGKKFIGTETVSGLATRGSYDMPSDSIRRWPARWDIPLTTGNSDYTCSSYDNCCAPWGSTHEETWQVMRKYDFLSGMYIWTGWDYLGEPTPYSWPARSSYFGIIDLAGFPKDIYYFYQSEWTKKPVLHIFPHWDLSELHTGQNMGDSIDVWAYTNFSEVELFLNDLSLGKKTKSSEDLHLRWRVAYTPGTLKAVAHDSVFGEEEAIVKTAGAPYAIVLEPDRDIIRADGKDLSFVTVKIVDEKGTLVPGAENLVNFSISGEGLIAGVDNGSEISHEPFKANYRKAYHGLCLVVIQSSGKVGDISLKATSQGLKDASINIIVSKE